AAHEQSGAEQENERESDLKNNQRFSPPQTQTASPAGLCTLPERRRQVGPRGAPGWSEAKEKPGHETGTSSEAKDIQVGAQVQRHRIARRRDEGKQQAAAEISKAISE